MSLRSGCLVKRGFKSTPEPYYAVGDVFRISCFRFSIGLKGFALQAPRERDNLAHMV